jgi:hypothetical protein
VSLRGGIPDRFGNVGSSLIHGSSIPTELY